MNIEKRRAEIAARKAEIRKLIEGDTENKLNMDDLEKELRELNEEDEKLEKRQAIERMLNGGAAPASPAGLSNPVARSANQPAPESTEKLYRSAWLKTLQGKPLTDDISTHAPLAGRDSKSVQITMHIFAITDKFQMLLHRMPPVRAFCSFLMQENHADFGCEPPK